MSPRPRDLGLNHWPAPSALARLARLTLSAIIALVLLGFVATPSARAQTDDDVDTGLSVSSETVYAPDPDQNQIDVSTILTLTNVRPDERIDDVVRSYFFTSWTMALPGKATDFVATSGGVALTTSAQPDPASDQYVFGVITLPANLNYEQTITIEASYSVPGGVPRGDTGTARANESFLSFSIWAVGDPGEATVRINVPEGFSLDFQGTVDELTRVRTGNADYYEARSIAEPREFFAQVFGRNDAGLIAETAEIENGSATVRAWPDDPEWAAFVVEIIESDVPVIEELIGLPWPAGDIEVIETVTPYLYGYGGWFNADTGLIEVGERLDRDIILHELSHAWFNDDLVAGRWIVEGLAEEIAGQVIAITDGERPRPTKPDLGDPIRVPLEDWANPWRFSDDEAFVYEQYHYNASWWVLYQITDEIGIDGLADVLSAMDNSTISFVGEGPAEPWAEATDWRYFLDLLEEQAGATTAQDLFRTYVLDMDRREELDMRDATHSRYDDFVERSGSWGAPLILRTELAQWSFASARRRIDDAQQVLDLRDQIDARAAELEVQVSQLAEVPYEMADSAAELRSAEQLAQDQLESLDELGLRRAQIVERADNLALDVAFEPASFEAAVEQSNGLLDGLDELATQRDAVDRAALSLDLVVPAWPRADISDGVDDQRAVASERLDRLALIQTAEDRLAEPQSALARVGAFGGAPADALADARTAFESDQADASEVIASAARSAERLADNAQRTGITRLIWAAVAIAAITILLWLRRKK